MKINKHLLFIVLITLLLTPVYAEMRYKGHNFLILDDVYKHPVVTVKNNNKRVDYQQGAIKLCNNAGMELASKEDVKLLVDFLENKSKIGQINTQFWLKEIATGQVDSHTYINENSKDNAYVFHYNSVILPIQAYIGTANKVSGHNSWLQAICIAKAPPIDDAYRTQLIKDDYTTYLNKSGNSIFGYITKEYEKSLLNSADNKYLEQIKDKFQKIATSETTLNLQNEKIYLSEKEKQDLNTETLNIINMFNNILSFTD